MTLKVVGAVGNRLLEFHAVAQVALFPCVHGEIDRIGIPRKGEEYEDFEVRDGHRVGLVEKVQEVEHGLQHHPFGGHDTADLGGGEPTLSVLSNEPPLERQGDGVGDDPVVVFLVELLVPDGLSGEGGLEKGLDLLGGLTETRGHQLQTCYGQQDARPDEADL